MPLNLIELELLKTILAVNNNVYTKLKNLMYILFQWIIFHHCFLYLLSFWRNLSFLSSLSLYIEINGKMVTWYIFHYLSFASSNVEKANSGKHTSVLNTLFKVLQKGANYFLLLMEYLWFLWSRHSSVTSVWFLHNMSGISPCSSDDYDLR